MDSANPDERPTQQREYSGPGSTLGLAALIVLVVASLFWYYELRGDSTSIDAEDGIGVVALADELNPSGERPAARVDRVAPDFRLRTPDGGTLQLTDYRGEYVLVNFWASWCGPCRGETPDFQKFYSERSGSGFTIIGVNQQESAERAAEFTALYSVTYPIVLDRSGSVSDAYKVGTGLPITFLIDPDGIILEIVIGRVSEAQLAEFAQTYPL